MADRISTLPDNVISDHILPCLDLHDAVRTSILSRGWRYKWKMIPNLMLGSEFFDSVSDIRTWDPVGYMIAVNSILMQHTGQLDSFGLFIPELEFPEWAFDQPIHFMLRKGVRSFVMWCSEAIPRALPCPPFPCMHLEELELDDCVFNPPLGFAVFPNLKFLVCFDVSCSPNRLSSFIRNCIKLEKVRLVRLIYLDQGMLCIQSSTLRHLVLFDESFPQLNIPNMGKLHIFLEDYCVRYSKSLFTCSMVKLRHLTLGCYFLKSLSFAGITKELSAALTGLTTLTAHTIDREDMDVFSCLLFLVKSSPCLRHLNIFLMMDTVVIPPKIDSKLEVEKQTEYCFGELTHMNVSFMTGTAAELKFIGLILAHSPALKELSIKLPKGIDAVSEIKICRELLSLRRASPIAQIVFLKSSDYADKLFAELDY